MAADERLARLAEIDAKARPNRRRVPEGAAGVERGVVGAEGKHDFGPDLAKCLVELVDDTGVDAEVVGGVEGSQCLAAEGGVRAAVAIDRVGAGEGLDAEAVEIELTFDTIAPGIHGPNGAVGVEAGIMAVEAEQRDVRIAPEQMAADGADIGSDGEPSRWP